MEQTVLTPEQKKVIGLVADEPQLAGFYLSGGTALAAYYLGHRVSDDLDFFIAEKPDKIFLHAFIEKLRNELGAPPVRFERLYDRNQFFFQLGETELKIEFTQYSFRQLENTTRRDGIRVDSIRDLGANKLMAMLDRFEPKDYVDLFFLLRERTLEEIRQDAETKFGITVGAVFLGGELMKARRVQALPKMIRSLTVEELVAFFVERAKELSPEIFEE